MHIEAEAVSPCRRRLRVTLAAEEVDRAFDAVYRQLQKRVKLPGFRQGKVPRQLLAHHYRHSVEQEVFQKLVPEVLSNALAQQQLQAVEQPHIEHLTLTPGQPLQVVATVDVLPDIPVPEYRGWRLERRIPVVSEADVDRALAQLRERHAELRAVSGRAVQAGDYVLVSYQGTVDGRPVPALTGTHVLVEVGAGRLLPELESGLLGMQAGETRTLTVTFPESHPEPAVAGKTAQLQVTVSEIKEKVLPELDDEFAQAYEDAESLAALRQRLRRELEEAARQRAEEALQREIVARLVAENPIEVPDALVREQMRRLYLQQRRRETGREPSEADYAVDPETLRETYEAQAREMVRGQLLLRRIGEAAGITVEPAEVDAEVASLAARMAQNPEALKAAMARNGTLQALETRLRERKIFATILAAIDVTDTLVSEEAGA